MGLTFPVPGMMMKHWTPGDFPAELVEVRERYRGWRCGRRSALSAASPPRGQDDADYWVGRFEFGIAYLEALEAVRRAANAEYGAATCGRLSRGGSGPRRRAPCVGGLCSRRPRPIGSRRHCDDERIRLPTAAGQSRGAASGRSGGGRDHLTRVDFPAAGKKHRPRPTAALDACTIISLPHPAPEASMTTTTAALAPTMRPYHEQGEIDYARLDFDRDEPVLKPDAIGTRTADAGIPRSPRQSVSPTSASAPIPSSAATRSSATTPAISMSGSPRTCTWPLAWIPKPFGGASSTCLGKRASRRIGCWRWPRSAPGGRDIGRKRDLYARIGVPEYWRFDPQDGAYHGERAGRGPAGGRRVRAYRVDDRPRTGF